MGMDDASEESNLTMGIHRKIQKQVNAVLFKSAGKHSACLVDLQWVSRSSASRENFNQRFLNIFTDEAPPGSIHPWDRPCACPLLSCYPYHDPAAAGMISENSL